MLTTAGYAGGVRRCCRSGEAARKRGDIIIPGELFAIPPDRSSPPACGRWPFCLGDDGLAKNLGFRAFDLLEEAGEDFLYRPYEDRLTRLRALLGDGKRCGVVTTEEGERSEAKDHFHEWVDTGKFEGLVVRSEQGITYKVKPFVTIDAVVVAFGEREENGKPEVRELTVAVLRDDGTFHVLGSVGNGFGDGGRLDWHDRLSAIEMPSSFRMANREGTLCRFVKPEIIVEIKVSDLVDTDSRDLPVRRMTLGYDEKTGWSSVGTLPIVSLIHPVLVRERTDKVVDTANVGLDQIMAVVPFEGRAAKATPKDLSRSEVLKRGVWTKETKGNLAVRKYVAFATNKAEEDPNFPPYVVYFTDFSAGRKDPLKTEIRVTADRDMVNAYVESWIAENIKKGWDQVDA
ncbi:MAG: hypothetical protein R3E66_15605 [bacterium]